MTTLKLTDNEAEQLKKLLRGRIKFLTMITAPEPRYTRAGSIVIETEPTEATKEWQDTIDRANAKLALYKTTLTKLER